jgi:ubiquitin C-terminal hydrolase
MPLATVAATSRETKAPTKFRTAASVTATRGDIARVEMAVATAFAVSWNPFVKSKASAVATTIQRTSSSTTCS